MDLKDKVVLITGSSIGIGKETALAFAKEGAKVVITYNSNKKKGEEVFKECNKIKESFFTKLDVMSEDSIKKVVESVVDKFGTIDILVNNAGVLTQKSLLEQRNDEIDSQIDTNLKGLIKMTKAVLPFMQGQNEGIIINISSIAGKTGYKDFTTYCATKFGVRGFTQALADEVPSGIKVYNINPGPTATQMMNFHGTPPEKIAELIIKTTKGEIDVNSGGDVDAWGKFMRNLSKGINKMFG